MSARRTLAGIAIAVLATLFFAVIDTSAKYLAVAGVPAFMALWGRYIFQALSTTLVVIPMGGWSIVRTRRPLFHLLRGLLLITSSMLLYFALKFMPVGELTAIMLTAPLVITLVAGTFLKEHVSPLRWALVAGGFVGTMVIIRPTGETFTPAMLLPLAQVGTNCVFQILTSRMARTENPLTVNFYTGWVGALAVTPILPLVWEPQSAAMWLLLVGMGVFAAIGHFLLVVAYQRAAVASLTPYLYAQIGFAMLCGWLVFAHVPDGWALLGVGLIAACGVAGAWLTVVEHRQLTRAA